MLAPFAMQGLEENSHVWVIFVFHKNNNGDKVRRTWSEPGCKSFSPKYFTLMLEGGGGLTLKRPHL